MHVCTVEYTGTYTHKCTVKYTHPRGNEHTCKTDGRAHTYLNWEGARACTDIYGKNTPTVYIHGICVHSRTETHQHMCTMPKHARAQCSFFLHGFHDATNWAKTVLIYMDKGCLCQLTYDNLCGNLWFIRRITWKGCDVPWCGKGAGIGLWGRRSHMRWKVFVAWGGRRGKREARDAPEWDLHTQDVCKWGSSVLYRVCFVVQMLLVCLCECGTILV